MTSKPARVIIRPLQWLTSLLQPGVCKLATLRPRSPSQGKALPSNCWNQRKSDVRYADKEWIWWHRDSSKKQDTHLLAPQGPRNNAKQLSTTRSACERWVRPTPTWRTLQTTLPTAGTATVRPAYVLSCYSKQSIRRYLSILHELKWNDTNTCPLSQGGQPHSYSDHGAT